MPITLEFWSISPTCVQIVVKERIGYSTEFREIYFVDFNPNFFAIQELFSGRNWRLSHGNFRRQHRNRSVRSLA